MASRVPNFQLELMSQDPVIRESFQKLQQFFCDDANGLPALIRDLISATSTPGFTYGSGGNNPPGKFLQNDGVPSNSVGRVIPVELGGIARISIAQEIGVASRFTLVEHDGNLVARRDVITVDMAGSIQKVFDLVGAGTVVTPGRQLAVQVDSASPASSRNPDVGITLLGEI